MDSADDDDVISDNGLTFDVFRRAVKEMPQFCATVDHLNDHFHNVKKTNNAAICKVWGKRLFESVPSAVGICAS